MCSDLRVSLRWQESWSKERNPIFSGVCTAHTASGTGDLRRISAKCLTSRSVAVLWPVYCIRFVQSPECHPSKGCQIILFHFIYSIHLFSPPSYSRSTKSHPGPVVHISDNPMDEGKVWILLLLIQAFQTGQYTTYTRVGQWQPVCISVDCKSGCV